LRSTSERHHESRLANADGLNWLARASLLLCLKRELTLPSPCRAPAWGAAGEASSTDAARAYRGAVRRRFPDRSSGEDSMGKSATPISTHSVNEDEKEFLYQVGSAITEWAKIDERLFEICAAVLRASKQHVAIIYYRINTLSGRLSLVDELVKTVLPKKGRERGGHDHPITKSWTTINNDIDSRLSFRNQLAHSPSGPMTKIEDKPDGSWHITDIWWASYISRPEQQRGKNRDFSEIKIEDIKSHLQALAKIWMDLRDFEMKLVTLLAK
jgi:hypothetical protein